MRWLSIIWRKEGKHYSFLPSRERNKNEQNLQTHPRCIWIQRAPRDLRYITPLGPVTPTVSCVSCFQTHCLVVKDFFSRSSLYLMTICNLTSAEQSCWHFSGQREGWYKDPLRATGLLMKAAWNSGRVVGETSVLGFLFQRWTVMEGLGKRVQGSLVMPVSQR